VPAGFDSRQGFLPDARQGGQSLLAQPRTLSISDQVSGERDSRVLQGGKSPLLVGLWQRRHFFIVSYLFPAGTATSDG
jgi:hypothetical protein